MATESHISLIDLSKQLPFEIDTNLKKELCFGETLIISCGHYEGDIGEESSDVDSWPCHESTASEHSVLKDNFKPTIEITDFVKEEVQNEETLEEENNSFHFFFFPDCKKPLTPKGSSASLLIENGFPRLKAPEDATEKCNCILDSKGKCECDFKFPCKCGALIESECNCAIKEICVCEKGPPKTTCSCEKAKVCLCFGNLPNPICTCEGIQKPCICNPSKFPFPVCECKHKPTIEKEGQTYGEEFTNEETSIEEPCECQKIEPKLHCYCMKGQNCTCSEYCICDVNKICLCESTSSKDRICGDIDSTEICNCEVPLVCKCPNNSCHCFDINICKCGNPDNCKCNIMCECEKPCVCDAETPQECICLDPAEQLKKGLLCTCGKKEREREINKLKKVRAGKEGYRWCHDVDPHHTFFGYGYDRHDKIEYREEPPQKVHILGLYDKKDDYDETCPLHGIKVPPFEKKIRKPSLDCCSAVGGISISVETLGEDQDKFLIQVVSHSSKEGLKAGSKLVSIIDCNLHTMEENRTENITKKDTTKERRSYMAIVESGYYNKVTRICGERTVIKRLYHSFKNARNFLLEGANIVLLRYLGLRRYKGTLKTDTVLMGGEICESIYVCHGVSQAIVNGKPLFVVKVERHIIEPNGNIHQTLTVLTLRGYTVSHEWADNCYVLHINPLLNIIPEKDEIEPHASLRDNWRNDMQLFSDYLDMKSTRTSEGGRYMSENGALSNVVREYLQALLMLKPADALHFTHHYFASALSAIELPHNEYFEPCCKRVRYYFFEE